MWTSNIVPEFIIYTIIFTSVMFDICEIFVRNFRSDTTATAVHMTHLNFELPDSVKKTGFGPTQRQEMLVAHLVNGSEVM